MKGGSHGQETDSEAEGSQPTKHQESAGSQSQGRQTAQELQTAQVAARETMVTRVQTGVDVPVNSEVNERSKDWLVFVYG